MGSSVVQDKLNAWDGSEGVIAVLITLEGGRNSLFTSVKSIGRSVLIGFHDGSFAVGYQKRSRTSSGYLHDTAVQTNQNAIVVSGILLSEYIISSAMYDYCKKSTAMYASYFGKV